MNSSKDEDVAKMSQLLNDIKKEQHRDLKKGSVDAKNQSRMARIHGLYDTAGEGECKKMGDCLASEGGAKVFTDYIQLLTNNGKSDPRPGSHSKTFEIVSSLCWNFSHYSLNLCLELGKAGLFVILVANLERYRVSLEEVSDERQLILPFLAILHNCAKDSGARRYLAQAEVSNILPPYIRMKNTRLLVSKIVAILISSYPIEEGHSEKEVDVSMLYVIVHYLKSAVSALDHKHLGFTAEELVDGCKRLAENDSNKISIVNAGILPLLEKLLETGDQNEKTIAALTLWNLCFAEENQLTMAENNKIMSSLQNLGKLSGKLGHVSSGTLWFLEDQRRSQSLLQSGKSHTCESNSRGASSSSKGSHVMISYSAREKILALKIKVRLEKLGYLTWMDMDNNEGKNFEALKNAIRNSVAVLVIISQDYKAQPNCRMEAEMARNMQIPIIPILAEADYKMSGWLRLMLESKVCIDFCDPTNFENAISNLAKEIGDSGRAKSEEGKTADNLASPGRIRIQKSQDDASPVEPKSPVGTWSVHQVMNWATENKLAPERFQSVDGEALAYLRDMKKNSPEFYHNYVVEKLGISSLQALKNLSRGLEHLKL